MKKITLILLASAALACADDNDREFQETQRFIDQVQQETQHWLDQHRIEQELQHMRWEAQEREALEQQHYGW